jgi:hypothetical protein
MSFTLDLTRFAQKADADMPAVVRSVAMQAFKRVVYRTPVDTGRAVANWGCTIGKPRAPIQVEATDKSGNATIAAIEATVKTFSGDGSVFLVNNVPYIHELEKGSSQKSPQGMVGVTLIEMIGITSRRETLMSLKAATRAE